MRYAQVDARYYCGIDLHSREMYVTVIDQNGNVVFYRNMPNKFSVFNSFVKQYLPDMAVAVESSCYYYWLSDACREAGIPFYLGHALYMKAIHGAKTKNDRIDSKKIVLLLRGGLFPLAYSYPKEMRSTRDLLRRRHHFMWRRASTYSHLQILCTQQGILDVGPKLVKHKTERQQLLNIFADEDLQMMVSADLDYIDALDPIISQLELQMLLMTIPGVGDLLGLIILYETHDTSRFDTVQRYSSYCGVVKCERTSAGKRIAAKNTKIRNPYLKWAYGDIILKAQVVEPPIAKLYERLKSKYGIGRAKSIIAHRFAVAAYFMLKNKQVFDTERFCQSSKYK
jgi:transposase